ncbi:molybdopterin-binding protein [uncultured Allofournierella sp.]|uniref:molybdopterin-binding protein n=1 Tax=uncultured Allofournierella sp. TaxID=1940258 RepID=UPI0037507264
MKLIDTKDAVGHVLCHDITQIIPGVTKDAVFRKGHVVQPQDIPVLLSVGKDHLYVWEKGEQRMHENEAAQVLRAICQNEHMHPTPVKEGKIELIADQDGLLLVDVERMRAVNQLGEMMIASRASGFPVKKGDKLAGTRIIPLVIEKEKMERAQQVAGEQPLLKLLPFQPKKAGVITTGNEVFHGRIQDAFTPVIEKKLAEYGSQMTHHVILDDDHTKITAAIHQMAEAGVDLIICTGGMSVDPDDKTPLAIRNSGAQVVSYGAPVLPGAMFLLAYLPDGRPVMGLPGCVMYAKRTIFDLVLPKVLTNVPVTQADLAALGHGGLCLDCPVCIWPNCGFGKGV